jgi:integrase
MAKKRGNNEGTITRRKDGRWEAQVFLGRDAVTGKPKRVCFYGKTRQEVSNKRDKALHDIHQGTFVEPHKLLLGKWLDTWLQQYKRPKIRAITYDTYAMILQRHLKPALGHLALRDIRPEHLQRYYNEKGLNARTIRLHHKILSQALTQAEKNQLVVRNVCRLVELPRQTRREMSTLTVEQVTRQLLPALQNDRLYAAYLTLFMVGLRRGELLGLRWQDIDLNAGELHVRQTIGRVYTYDANSKRKTKLIFSEPKTEKSRRTIPVPDACLTALRHHKARQAEEKLMLGQGYQDHGLVFSQADGTPIEPRSLNLYFTQALKRTGLPPKRLHDCRHAFSTWLLEQGIHPKVVSNMLGHSSISVTLDIYSHVSLELEKQAAAKLNAALMGGK